MTNTEAEGATGGQQESERYLREALVQVQHCND